TVDFIRGDRCRRIESMSGARGRLIDQPGLIPAEWVARLSGDYISPAQLYATIKGFSYDNENIIIFGDKEVVMMPKDYQQAHLDWVNALRAVRILVGKDEYTIRAQFDSDHSYGEGGTAVSSASLRRNGAAVLTSVRVASYATCSGDIDDYELSSEKSTYLV